MMKSLEKLYHPLKDAPIKLSKYLGAADIIEHYYPDQPTKRTWGMSSYQFVIEAIPVVEDELEKIGKWLPTKESTPLWMDYPPKLDITPLLNPQQANYYQELLALLESSCQELSNGIWHMTIRHS